MRICILCENKNIDEARLNCKNIFPSKEPELKLPDFLMKKEFPKTHLSIPCSETGTLPATHWFCFMSCDEANYKKMVETSLYSTIEESGPKEFLEKWNLQIIK